MRVEVVGAWALAVLVFGSAAGASQATGNLTAGAREAGAYEQFLLGRYFEAADKVDEAVAAYKHALALDPGAADIPAELAALYMRQNRAQDALKAAEQSLAIDSSNVEAHRVAGFVYAALAESGTGRRAAGGVNGKSGGAPGNAGAGSGTSLERSDPRPVPDENAARAIQHLEAANRKSAGAGEPDANLLATLSHLYLQVGAYTKAIPILEDLVQREPEWQDGPTLLAEAFTGAGQHAQAIAWFEQAVQDRPQLYPTLAEFYEREHRWKDAARAYTEVARIAPLGAELQMRYASALLSVGAREEAGKARDLLTRLAETAPNDGRVLYLLSQAQRRLGDLQAAEATARRVIARNASSPWGYYALAEALEERRQFQAVIDVLTPAVADARAHGGDAFQLGLLLPHLGFAHQELGQFDKALSIFEEAHRLAPADPTVAGYLIQANLAAKRFSAAAELAHQARADRPDDLRLARLEAEALRQTGKADQAVGVLEAIIKVRGDDPSAYVALAQLYSDADRASEGVTLLSDARAKFPADESIPFELGALLDKQKRFVDAEAAFKDVLARDPDNAPALNYLGYMLAERGERLQESIGYIKKALELEPENGSYLDSLGWAYYKADQLDLAEQPLKQAAEQMANNSVVQDHYGDLLFKRGRYGEAITAWTHALAGDGESVDRSVIDRKIKSARQKLGKQP